MPQLPYLPHSLLLGILTIMCVIPVPLPGYTEELTAQPDQPPIPELELIKEEETVSIASRHNRPISHAPCTKNIRWHTIGSLVQGWLTGKILKKSSEERDMERYGNQSRSLLDITLRGKAITMLKELL